MRNPKNKVIDIIIPIFNGYSVLKSCLESVVKHFDNQARLILFDDGSTDPNIAIYLEEIKQKAQFPVLIYRNQNNQGFVKTINQAINLLAENDIIILHSDTIVTPNWIKKLRNAAYIKDNIATVTPLSNNATIFSVPEFGEFNEIPEGYNIESFAKLIEESSFYLYPEVPVGHGFCLYIKQTTFNLLGGFDEKYNRNYGGEDDFCLRVLGYSLCNIMADDTFIYHFGDISDTKVTREKDKSFKQELLLQKYPFYWNLIQFYQNNRPFQIWDNIQTKIRKIKIGLDGRCLDEKFAGNQRYLIELIKAYTEQITDIQIDLLVSNGSENYIKHILETFGVKKIPNLIEEATLQKDFNREIWDIFHITFQGSPIENLVALRPNTKRIILTLQDFILAKNPFYFENNQWFEYYYSSLQLSLASVDGVITISNFIKEELLDPSTFAKQSKSLITPERIKTVYHGLNQNYDSTLKLDPGFFQETGIIPKRYLLFVGNDYLHKNLEATVKVLKETRQLGYDYQLVIVGNTITQGGSKEKVQKLLDAEQSLKENVFFLNHVSDEKLLQLYRNAGVLLYLSNSEGFGFPPLEAFANDCPVIASKLTSIPEVAGEGAIYFYPGEIKKIALAVIELIENEQERNRAIQKGKQRVQKFDWRKTAKETIDFYYHILHLPTRFQNDLPLLYLRSQQFQQIQTELQQTKHELEQTKHELEQTKHELEQTKHELEQTKHELEQTKHEIEAMKSSKFWKLRQIWFQFKSQIGLK